MAALADLLARHQPGDPAEAADVERVRTLLASSSDPWSRDIGLHVTASALIVHPATKRVLLRWHRRQGAWLQVGGHGDPGESDPVCVARREAVEESGLTDLVPWPDSRLVHVAIVPVRASGSEPAHEHADLRFVFATAQPESARPERPSAPLRWVTVSDAAQLTGSDTLRVTLSRVAPLLRV